MRDPIGEIAEQSGCRCEVGDRAHPGDAARRHDPPRAADADGDEPRRGRAGGVAVSRRRSSTRRSTSCSSDDPFSGHVVIRSTDAATPGSNYRLWTTVKVPQGYSIEKHCALSGAADRRRAFPRHARQPHLRPRRRPRAPQGDGAGQQVGRAGRGEGHDEGRAERSRVARADGAEARARAGGVHARSLAQRARARRACRWRQFFEVAESLNARGVIGRFSTFLEHVKPLQTGERVTRFNALFHWAVPPGREIEAGREVGRFHILTHCYWREGGAGVPQREHHGRRARNGEGRGARAQGAPSTSTSQSIGIPVTLHERLLGRPQRDQAVARSRRSRTSISAGASASIRRR